MVPTEYHCAFLHAQVTGCSEMLTLGMLDAPTIWMSRKNRFVVSFRIMRVKL